MDTSFFEKLGRVVKVLIDTNNHPEHFDHSFSSCSHSKGGSECCNLGNDVAYWNLIDRKDNGRYCQYWRAWSIKNMK